MYWLLFSVLYVAMTVISYSVFYLYLRKHQSSVTTHDRHMMVLYSSAWPISLFAVLFVALVEFLSKCVVGSFLDRLDDFLEEFFLE